MTMFLRSLFCCLSLQFSFFPLLCCVFLRETWLAAGASPGIRPGQRLGPTKHKYAVMLANVGKSLWPNGQGVGLLQQHFCLGTKELHFTTRPCGPMDKALVYFNSIFAFGRRACVVTPAIPGSSPGRVVPKRTPPPSSDSARR